MGLMTVQLERRRSSKEDRADNGLFLGAFGWVEALRPENKVLTTVQLADDLAQQINRDEKAPLMRDSTNGGLIHAPSVNHAITAPILGNGFVGSGGHAPVQPWSSPGGLGPALLWGVGRRQSRRAALADPL